MARTRRTSGRNRALRRLRTLRAIHEKPRALRSALGLKRRKESASQKLLRLLSPK